MKMSKAFYFKTLIKILQLTTNKICTAYLKFEGLILGFQDVEKNTTLAKIGNWARCLDICNTFSCVLNILPNDICQKQYYSKNFLLCFHNSTIIRYEIVI